MASSIMKKTCAKCNKGAGTAMCYGCEHAYCTKHFIEHRQELSQQMDNIGQEHDLLQRDMVDEHCTHPLLSSIDQWEQESITKIQGVAESARTDLRQLLDRTKDDLKTSVSKMTTEVQSSRESDDYTEVDIMKWTEQLKEIRNMLDNPSTIKIDYDDDTRSAIRLIKVIDQQTSNVSFHTSPRYEDNNRSSSKFLALSPEIFDELFGEIWLSKDRFSATRLNRNYIGACAGGIGRYSSGAHRIRFRIEQKSVDYCFFFGIVTSSQEMTKEIWCTSSAYGWWDFGRTVINGKHGQNDPTIIFRNGDEVTLILDCDNRLIELQHDQTNRVDQIPIDLQHCSFPWKMTISLFAKDDCVRILH